MSESQPTNEELMRALEPLFSLFASVGEASVRDHFLAIPILGLPTKIERAGELHRAMRNNFRRVCDIAEPLLTPRDGPDGDGLDYVTCNIGPRPIIVRWGRYNGSTVRRNDTCRTQQAQEQGRLFTDDGSDPGGATTVTLGMCIADDYTEAGVPCWYMDRMLLLRERIGDSEVITQVQSFAKPNREGHGGEELPPPVVRSREQEVREWERMIERIRRSA